MALSDKWTTLFLLFGGPEPLVAGDLATTFAPYLTANFKAFDMPRVSTVVPDWKYRSDTDPQVTSGGQDVGYYVTIGALADVDSTYPAPYPYVSGLLWQLYNKSVPTDLRAAMTTLRGEPFQTYVDAGYTVMHSGLYPYGTPIYGYLGWPSMPALPSTTAAPAASSSGTPWWLLAVAGGVLALASGKRRRKRR